WCDLLLRQTPPEIDYDRAVMQRGREESDQGDDAGAKCREGAWLEIIADSADDRIAFTVAVENATQAIVVIQKRVGLIDRKRRAVCFNHPKDRGRGYVQCPE